MNKEQEMIHFLGLALIYVKFIDSSFNDSRSTRGTL